MNHSLPVDRLEALADPTRLRILEVLRREELVVRELTELLGMAQSRVSGHLAVLREAGLVRDRRQGTSAYYSLVEDGEALTTWEALRPTLPPTRQTDEDLRHLDDILRRRRETDREFFDRAAVAWNGDRSESLGFHAGTAALAALVPRELTVLDLGTGTGGLLPLLAGRVARVLAVDFSRAMLGRAGDRMRSAAMDNVTLIRGEAEHLPLPPASVDGAVLNMVLHHLADPAACLREAARVLRPGGRSVIVDFASHDESWLMEEEGHRWPGFDPAQIGAWGIDAGFGLPDMSPVPTPEGGRWSRLDIFTARLVRRNDDARGR